MTGARPALLDAGDLEGVIDALDRGSVVGLPTDTVYGLAARLEAAAVDRIFVVKGRPPALALPVLLGGRDQVGQIASSFPSVAAALAERFWPGPLTLVLRARRAVGALVGGNGRTVGVRWPNHPLMEQLCLAMGPLAVTSANRHGEPPAVTADEVIERFLKDEVELVVDGGRSAGTPSSVVDCSRARPTCLREGAIEWAEIESVLVDPR